MDKAEARKRLLRAARYVEEWGNIIADVAGKDGLNTDESLAMSVNADIISVAAWLDTQPAATERCIAQGGCRERGGHITCPQCGNRLDYEVCS